MADQQLQQQAQPPQQQPPPAVDAQALAAAVAAAVQQIMNNMPLPAAPAAPAAPAVAPAPFAKTPSRAIVNQIDLQSKIGQAVYKDNCSKLPTTFTLDTPDIPVLIDELTVRAKEANWINIFDIVIDNTTVPPVTKNMLTNYLSLIHI